MAADYQLTDDPNLVLRTADNAMIPNVAGNAAWEGYMHWLGKGYVPDPYVPPAPSPAVAFAEKIAAGLELTWSSSTLLNATYAIDPTTQMNMMAEIVSILANGTFGTGQSVRPWADITGRTHEMTVTQFRLLATAVQGYVNMLYGVELELMGGQQATWPSNQININGWETNMTVSTIVQETVVDNVGSTVISPVTQDPNTNLFLRTITVNSPPDSNGNIAVQFTLHISGATQAAVELSSPTAIQINAPSGTL